MSNVFSFKVWKDWRQNNPIVSLDNGWNVFNKSQHKGYLYYLSKVQCWTVWCLVMLWNISCTQEYEFFSIVSSSKLVKITCDPHRLKRQSSLCSTSIMLTCYYTDKLTDYFASTFWPNLRGVGGAIRGDIWPAVGGQRGPGCRLSG